MSDLLEQQASIATSRSTSYVKYVMHFFAIIFWIYVVIKLFVFDIDVFVIGIIANNLLWILDYKIFSIIFAVAFSMLIFSRWQIVKFFMFILFYPAISIIYLPLYMIWKTKSWMLLVAVVNGLAVFVNSFRLKFLMFSVFLASILVILVSLDQMLLWVAGFALVGLNCIEYISSIVSAFKMSKVIGIYKKIPDIGKKFVESKPFSEKIKDLPPVCEMNPSQLAAYRGNLQISLIVSRACLFSATILRDYKRSGFPAISGAVATLFLFIYTVVVFFAVNLAICKIDIDSFKYDEIGFPSMFTFFHYSFNTMVFASTRELMAVSPLSYAANMIQILFVIVLSVVFVSQLIATRRQKFTEELDDVIEKIRLSVEEMEQNIYKEYGVGTWEGAIAEIKKMEQSMAELLLFLSSKVQL